MMHVTSCMRAAGGLLAAAVERLASVPHVAPRYVRTRCVFGEHLGHFVGAAKKKEDSGRVAM